MSKKNTIDVSFSKADIDYDIKNIISTIKFRRIEKNISQQELANRVGLKQSAIARIESNKIMPKIDTILLLSKALGLKLMFKRISTEWNKF